MPLLEIDRLRVVTLHALTILTHHGGLEAHLEIAKETSTLTGIMEKYPDDPKSNELAVCVISHSAGAALSNDNVPADVKNAIDAPLVINHITSQLPNERVQRPRRTRQSRSRLYIAHRSLDIVDDHGTSQVMKCVRRERGNERCATDAVV